MYCYTGLIYLLYLNEASNNNYTHLFVNMFAKRNNYTTLIRRFSNLSPKTEQIILINKKKKNTLLK